MLATGRSFAATVPVLDYVGITPRFLVCSNGAITMRRDPGGPSGYRRASGWSPSTRRMRSGRSMRTLRNARFAVEDEHGHYRCTGPFPGGTIGPDSEHVEFDSCSTVPPPGSSRWSPDHDADDFLAVVEEMGLRR